MPISYLPLFPTPGAPITATLTSPSEDFLRRMPRIPLELMSLNHHTFKPATAKSKIVLAEGNNNLKKKQS